MPISLSLAALTLSGSTLTLLALIAVGLSIVAVVYSIANAGLPNITLVGACPAEGAALGRLVRKVDVVVCSTSAADQVRALAGTAVEVLIDDRALDQRAIEMLAGLLVQPNGNRPAAAARLRPRRSGAGHPVPAAARERARGRSDAPKPTLRHRTKEQQS